MWNVLIVDDEPKIRRGLCRFIESMSLPLHVCAQACDGEQAIELALRNRPHIILLDICMPHMDGLAFLSTLREHAIMSKCILITGFDHFAYAQTSVALKAHAYLLKPVDIKELQKHLASAVEELQKESTIHQWLDMTRSQIQRNKPALLETFVQQWMAGKLSPAELDKQFRFWEIAWPAKATLLLVYVDLHAPSFYNQGEKHLMLFAVQNIMGEWLEHAAFHAHDSNTHCFAILDQAPDDSLVSRLTDQIAQYLELYCETASAPLSEPNEFGVTFRQLEERRKQNAVPEITERAQRYIMKHLSDASLSLNDTAYSLGISGAYLSRLLKQSFNTSFSEYVIHQRITASFPLLRDPNNKIAFIAAKVGYANQHYFSTAFKKATGLTPSQFRQKEQ